MENQINYFDVIAVNNSSLDKIDPEQGGSPIWYNSAKNYTQTKASHFSIGDDIHQYILEPHTYHAMQTDKPSSMMGLFCDAFLYVWNGPGMLYAKVSTVIESNEKTSVKNMEECGNILLEFQSLAISLYGNTYTDEQLDKAARVFRYSRGDFYKSGKELTVLTSFNKEAVPYIVEMLKNSDKRGMTKEDKTTVSKCINSIFADARCYDLMAAESTLINDPEVYVYNELEIVWDDVISFTDIYGDTIQVPMKRKSKIDRLIIDTKNKIIREIDLKSTGFSVSTFGNRFRGEFVKRKYYRQRAYYKEAIIAFLSDSGIEYDEKTWKYEAYMVVVETQNQFQAAAFYVPKYWMMKGAEEVKQLLSRIAYHEFNNEWITPLEKVCNSGYLRIDEPVI